ncbi:MAG: hypothetical protein GX957_06190, partial [Clostridiaceae bacterium]|nr:hypothetical protein [Clostridiaceae bacterium]
MFAKISNSIKIKRSSDYFKIVVGQKEMRLFFLLAGMVAIMAFLRPDNFF